MTIPAAPPHQVLFIAPDYAPPAEDHDAWDDHDAWNEQAGPSAAPWEHAAPRPRMTRSASAAAAAAGISDDRIHAAVDSPDDVAPDPKNPSRTIIRGQGLRIVAGADGTIIAVYPSKGSGRRPRR